ncbi:hypothetical protein SBF1_1020007 [Candidatus Desulfosporosinus infrequens]|uniref:Uncharacterized protein n=1 Tax=Candidatus Desulfosporosinus infrequens TaxID=2043169 RepID=A0A2U3JWE0_9FIRM|nr:hypothetical protein SBF1_1020007 [Candidatus Desulfosporosinus infrequens]
MAERHLAIHGGALTLKTAHRGNRQKNAEKAYASSAFSLTGHLILTTSSKLN